VVSTGYKGTLYSIVIDLYYFVTYIISKVSIYDDIISVHWPN
jgi:hypothetical protein